jgi:hypothetical protein
MLIRGAERIPEEHRDGERANTTRHRRQGAGDRGDVRVDIADDDGPSPSEGVPAL